MKSELRVPGRARWGRILPTAGALAVQPAALPETALPGTQLPAPLPRRRQPAGFGAATFAALRHRDFRLFYYGQLLSLIGTWMQSTAQGWLVLELTDSELVLGAVSAAGALPAFLLTLYAGVVADRADKRRIIIVAQAVLLLEALALGVLTQTGHIGLGWMLGLILVAGAANAFEVPTRQSYFADLVGREDLTNAIALNSSAFNLTRIIGPALAGMLLGVAGVAACFYVNAVSYLAVLAGLFAIRRPPLRALPPAVSVRENLREGVRYLRASRLACSLVALTAAITIFAYPYAMLLPVFARDVLDVGAAGLGMMLSATGAGALLGGIGLAATAGQVRRGRMILVSGVGYSLFMAAFALSPSFPLSLGLLAGVGFTMIPFAATINALLQSLAPDALRGRVMGVYCFMAVGLTPLGSLQAGALARFVGAPLALAVGAAALLAIVLLTALRVPELREVR